MAGAPGGIDPNALLQSAAQQQQQQNSGILGKIGNFIGHPVVQAALGTYLGALTSPRYMGLGGAIGRGGLLGLQEFGQARALQGQQLRNMMGLAKDASGIQANQARAGMEKTHGQLYGKQLESFSPDKDEATTWQMLKQQETDPNAQRVLDMLSHAAATGKGTFQSRSQIYNTMRQGNLKAAVDQANITLAKQKTATSAEALREMPQLTGAKIAGEQARASAALTEAGAAVGREGIEASLAGPRREQLETSAIKNRAEAAVAGETKPPSDPALQHMAHDMATKDWAAQSGINTRAGLFGGTTGDEFIAKREAEYLTSLKAAKEMRDPATGRMGGGATPRIPAGAKPVYDPSGKLVGYKRD